MNKILPAVMLAVLLLAALGFFIVTDGEGSDSDDLVWCCRYDCHPAFCKKWPRGCYRTSSSLCKEWEKHGHAKIVMECFGECSFPRKSGTFK